MFNIVLFEPEIPPNTGNIGRLCVATNSKLFLIKPLGFSLSDKHLKRAGLDYWPFLNYEIIDSLDVLLQANSIHSFYFLTTKSSKSIFSARFKTGDFLVFGPESRGLPEKYIKDTDALTIPMYSQNIRSINLATSVGIVLYEAIRQQAVY